ncbi:unnamed protein product [Allacma fusca]|uniref:Uncharacterized protein n=1 Tax=Allacma fusca TaxID=39272 RepID=A0A8J2L7L7_9HEXA|nr:unnamed protein product [Allacma fusca]
MSLSRIQAALDNVGLRNRYLQKFVEHQVDDETVEEIVSDTTLAMNLNAIIPVVGHRIKFQKAFKALPIEPTSSINNVPLNDPVSVRIIKCVLI